MIYKDERVNQIIEELKNQPMKSVLIAIQPKWCELIASGKKTIEVRKTAPKLETPFKCYIYCTLTGSQEVAKDLSKWRREKWYEKKGRIIGEFVCDRIEMVNAQCSDSGIDLFYHNCEKYGCLSQVEVEKYFGVYDEERTKDLRSMKGNGYAWHITDLKIYDKPKELGEFFVKGECENYDFCRFCSNFHEGRGWLDGSTCDEDDCVTFGIKPIRRPPQSWCYVEE